MFFQVKKSEAEKTNLRRVLDEANQKISSLDETRSGLQKESSELRASLREGEKARLEARRELQQLHNQVKMLDGECLKSKKEVADLKDQLAKDEHLIDECRRDNYNLKQKLVESDGQREAAKREIQHLTRRIGEAEEDTRVREKDLSTALEESRRGEIKAQDKVKNLENILDNATQDNSDLKLKLSGAEGRITGLEAQLARMESAKNDVEFKLTSLHSTLRRTLGIRPPGESGR